MSFAILVSVKAACVSASSILNLYTDGADAKLWAFRNLSKFSVGQYLHLLDECQTEPPIVLGRSGGQNS
jgi:hypothetical protein